MNAAAAPPPLAVVSSALSLSEAVDLLLVTAAFAPDMSVLLLEPAASECTEELWRRMATHGIGTVYAPDASRAATRPPSAPVVAPLSDRQVAAMLDGAAGILSL